MCFFKENLFSYFQNKFYNLLNSEQTERKMSNFHPMTEIPTSENSSSDRRESATSTTSTKSDKKLKLKQGYLPEQSKSKIQIKVKIFN